MMADEARVLKRVERVNGSIYDLERSKRVEILRDGESGAAISVALACHLCSQVKQGADPDRVLYELAFHYDRRHKGWTT